MSDFMRDIAVGIALKMGGPTKVLVPLLRNCPEDQLQDWVSKILECGKTQKWDKLTKEAKAAQVG